MLQHKGKKYSRLTSSIEHLINMATNTNLSPRHTSIICTLGPASQSVHTLKQMILAGMNVARLNFSHGSHEYHLQSVVNVREAERQLNLERPVSIALDTKGPEIRTGILKDGENTQLKIRTGNRVVLTTDKAYERSCDLDHIYVTYERITNVVKPGDNVFIDDGLINLEIKAIEGTNVICRAINNGKLGSRKGVNLPDANVDLPTLSEKDIEDLKFGLQHGVDFIFASFIRTKEAVNEIREKLGIEGKNIKIISKLENQQGLNNIDEILEASDGIMIARGDLGIEIPLEKVVAVQKIITAKCNMAGKPVICATQMLESMTENLRPTRAEVSDVANAVLDGADCIMLSGETAKGKYPVECVKLMDCIAREAEACTFYEEKFLNICDSTPTPLSPPEATAIAAVEASFKMRAPVIVVLTSTGVSARLIAKYYPKAIILVVTRYAVTARSLNIHRGCYTILMSAKKTKSSSSNALSSLAQPAQQQHQQTRLFVENMDISEWMDDIEKRFNLAMKIAKANNFIKKGDSIICVTGWRAGAGTTNTVRIMHYDTDDT